MPAQVVAIVGRPNVGKSSLFNRVVGRRMAVVDDMPGVTRDRLETTVQVGPTDFVLMDTGGFVPDPDDRLIEQVRAQVDLAMHESTLIWFVIDMLEGVSPNDHTIAQMLHETGTPVILVPHKVDNEQIETTVAETYELGFDQIVPVSSIHGRGVAQLMNRTGDALRALDAAPGEATSDDEPQALRIAIVGRPNAGKSALTNAILGRERVIVDDRPGTTRDAISTLFTWQNAQFELIDTAGMRRRSRIEKRAVEEHCVLRATQSVRRCDVAWLVLDVTRGIAHQDKTIARFIAFRGKLCILVVNKWDLIEKETGTFEQYAANIRDDFRAYDYLPLVFTSAVSGQRVQTLLELSQSLFTTGGTRVRTPELNDFLRGVTLDRPHPLIAGRRPSMKYATQAGVLPPTFVVFTSMADSILPGYERYLIHQLREQFDFEGVPIKMVFRDSRAGSPRRSAAEQRRTST